MKTLIIILLLIPCTLPAQANAYEALIGFEKYNYKPFEYEYQLCPWQSFRLLPYLSMQIDIVVDDVALSVIQKEPWLLSEAVLFKYNNDKMGYDMIEIIRRFSDNPGSYKIHHPGLSHPIWKYYSQAYVGDALNITRQGYAGWYYQARGNNTAIGVKKLDENKWQVSCAMFLRGQIPGLQNSQDSLGTDTIDHLIIGSNQKK